MSENDEVSVLHVDDEQGFADVAREFLERENDRFAVTTATSADSGLEHLASASVDCVVSDLDMPGRDGLEFLKIVRERHGDLPFILFTGKGSEEVAADAIAAGVTDYIQKGTGTDTFVVLANRIENAIGQHRAERRVVDQARRLDLLRTVNQWLVQAQTRSDVETGLTDILADHDSYTAAWIARHDEASDRIVPEAAGGLPGGTPSPHAFDTVGDRLVARALRSGELVVGEPGDPTVELWDEDLSPQPYAAVAVVPISYQESLLRVMAVCAERGDTFDAPERRMLEEIAGDVGQAIHTAIVREELEQHRTAVQNVPEGVFLLDEHGYIDLVNPAAAQLVHETPADLEGKPFPTYVERGVFDQSVIDWYLDAVRDLLSSESATETARFRTQIRPMDDEARQIEINLSTRPFEEDFRGTVGILREVATAGESRSEPVPE